ncbi:hypothetical protein ACF0H5_014326 [Mactra antiquata]
MEEDSCKTVSFGFSKKSEKKVVVKSQLSENVDVEEETEYVTSLENKKVKSTKPKDEKKEIIIPLIKTNNWKTKHAEKIQDIQGLDSQAVNEIMQDTAKQLDDWQSRDVVDSNIPIPLLMQNKVPEGFETDENFDVSLRPDEPEDTDYDEVPIEAFGMAMLKGMGWKPGQGIGKNNKNAVAPVEAALRPKGMGLGADRKPSQDINDVKQTKGSITGEDSVQLVMKKGAYCLIENGPHRDLYAVIEGIDEDNARLMLKLTVSGKMVTVSQYNTKLVTKEEYKQYSKYINKGDADRYKEKEERKNKDKEQMNGKHEVSDRHRKHGRDDRGDSEDSKSRLERKRNKYLHQEEDKSHKKRKYDDDRSQSSTSYSDDTSRSTSYMWAVPKLRVRLIDKHYKKGKYYKEKVIIIDVPDIDHCVCKTDDGKVLEDISQSMMETVVPKSDRSHVYVVSGKYRGQLAQVLERDKRSCKATLQLLSNRDKVLLEDYDSICEYIGDIHEEFDY